MSNPSKAKGTAAETAFVAYLRRRGWLHAERRALSGSQDKGDVAGLPGVVLEVKNCRTVQLGAWLKEAAVEQRNADAVLGVVVNKPHGVGLDRVGDWHAHLTVRQLCDLLAAAGYRAGAQDGAS